MDVMKDDFLIMITFIGINQVSILSHHIRKSDFDDLWDGYVWKYQFPGGDPKDIHKIQLKNLGTGNVLRLVRIEELPSTNLFFSDRFNRPLMELV